MSDAPHDATPRGTPAAGSLDGPPTDARGPRHAVARLVHGIDGDRARAILRVLVAAVVGGVLLARPDGRHGDLATIVPVLGGLYVLVSSALWWTRERPGRSVLQDRRTDELRAALDVVVLCAVALTAGEPRTAILIVLCAVPLGHGLTLPAASVLRITAVAIAGTVAVWATGPLLDHRGLPGWSLLVAVGALAWSGMLAALIAVERDRHAERIGKLSASVRDMLRQALRAEETERARVADLLHDDVLQVLLSTRHDIAEAIDGDLALLPDARTSLEAATRRLRETIVALRDEGQGDQELATALQGLAGESAAANGATVEVELGSALGSVRSPVLVAAARDLVRDAESGTAADRVRIAATREFDDLVLVVRHEDRRYALGIEPTAESSASLADVSARVQALDGALGVDRGPAGERIVTIRVPAVAGPRTGLDGPASWPASADPSRSRELR